MTKKEVNLAIINGLKSKEIKIAEIELNHLEAFGDIMHKAINVKRCCKSDSELLCDRLSHNADIIMIGKCGKCDSEREIN